MEFPDFVSVMTVFWRNINEELCHNQLEVVEKLFGDIGFDKGFVC